MVVAIAPAGPVGSKPPKKHAGRLHHGQDGQALDSVDSRYRVSG